LVASKRLDAQDDEEANHAYKQQRSDGGADGAFKQHDNDLYARFQ